MAGHMPGSLIFHHNGAGDYLLSLPALRAIARRAPRPLHVVSGATEAAFLYDELDVDRLIRVPTRHGHFQHRFSAADAVNLTPPYDCFVSLATWFNDDVQELGARAAARWSAGLFPHFDVRPAAAVPGARLHDIDRLFALARLFDPDAASDDWFAPPVYPADATAFAGRFAASLPAGATMLVVHADSRPEKNWPLAPLDLALEALGHNDPALCIVVLNRGPRDLPRTAQLARHRFLGGISLACAMAVTSRSDCFLGIDSCMLHVADFHRIPGVALFGPTPVWKFGYRVLAGSGACHLQAPAGRLADLPVDDVVSALLRVVAQS